MINGYHNFTKGKNMKRASYTEVCHWIMKSWNIITLVCIKIAYENQLLSFMVKLQRIRKKFLKMC